jgi:acyl transferase domain-containing protein/acyl carrier protein
MSERNGLEVAIIGMAGRFPKAKTLEQFWQNLRDGVEGISFFTDEELAGHVPPSVLANPNYVKAAGVLEEVDLFDAAFFDFSPRDAEIIDPQQRLLLECGWEALERAGYSGSRRTIGAFAGASQNIYLLNNILANPEIVAAVGTFALMLANEKDFVATRLAYKLGLEGPCVTVQTACSTSLVATHLACQSLLAGECELALAGGVSARAHKGGHLYQRGGILSPDGHTRAFDARAQGTADGQGVGVVVLKLLEEALADGDHVHAVIKGSAINNDGAQKPGFTAPRRDAQARAIRAAQARAEVAPDSIGYVETHGTATPLGDPIEVAALARAFRPGTERRGFCALGSVKTNIGHLDAAAGVASLIKTVLALEHGEIPPSLHFETPNPEIDFAASPFYVNTRLSPWPSAGGPRRAGVSSFGMGGANAHIVIEEAPPAAPAAPSRPCQLLLLSARTATALERATDDLAAHLRAHPEQELADVAFTLRVGRTHFRHRRALVATGAGDAAAVLAARDPRRLLTAEQEPGDRPLAFLLPGVGDQYAGMAAGLYASERAFREEIDRCAELLLPELGLDLRQVLFAGGMADPAAGERTGAGSGPPAGLDLRAMLRRGGEEAPTGPLHQTRVAQPAVFALGWSLARLWISWGVRPQALLGYSLGEYTAACLAGVMSLADALAVVARRARMIDELPAGAMLAVPLPEAEAARRLTPELSLAAINAPAVCVVAGPVAAVAELEQDLAQEGLLCRRIPTSHAFHSRMMEPLAGPFLELMRTVELRPPQLPYLANVTGTWARAGEVTDPAYWVRHLCQTVRFADAAGELWREPGRLLLEIGPGQSLGSLALQHPASAGASRPIALPSLRHAHDRQDDQAFLLRALGQLWLAGADADPDGFYAGERRRRVPLPTYPFERQRHWVERRAAPAAVRAAAPGGKIADLAGWFHAPAWKLTPQPAAPPADRGPWLVLADDLGVGARLVERLEAQGREVFVAGMAGGGEGFCRRGDRSYALDPRRDGDYDALLAAFDAVPETVVHLWSLTAHEEPPGAAALATARDLGFYSLVALAQALGKRSPAVPVEICVVTNGLCGVERGDLLQPEKALLVGPVRVIPQEYPHLLCRAIDVDVRELGGDLCKVGEEPLAGLVAELCGRHREPLIARRGGNRWAPDTEPVRLGPVDGRPARLREEGVYLITGGLGGIGLALAGHLARTLRAKVALVGRTPLPERAAWQRWLDDPAAGATARRVREVQALEAAGAEVLVLAADVADEERLREVVARVRERFGRLDGVFHAAGVPGAGLVQLKTRDMAAGVLAPKVDGTLALAAVLRDAPVDFLVLFSAITALTGGIGQVDYCAANAFLGAFAQHSRRRGGVPTLAVDWCEWQWDDWAERLNADPGIQAELQRQRRTYGLSFEEGMEALWRALASELPEVIVSTRSLQAVREQQHSVAEVLAALGRRTHQGDEHSRPALGVLYVAPGDEAEQRLVEIWRTLLGIGQVGIHDDFFQLGGHSLLGLQLMARVYEAFAVELPLRALFEAPTVAALAAAIAAARDQGTPANAPPEIRRIEPADPQQLLANLDELSDQEMDALLAEMMAEEEGI